MYKTIKVFLYSCTDCISSVQNNKKNSCIPVQTVFLLYKTIKVFLYSCTDCISSVQNNKSFPVFLYRLYFFK